MGCFPLHLLKACSTGSSSKIKIMTVDGRCLRFAAPIIAKEVLMEFPCHTLFLSDSVRSLGDRARPLHSTISLQPGNVYFIVPQSMNGSHVQSASIENSTAPASSVATSRSTRQRKVSFATSADSSRGPLFDGRHVESAESTASLKKSSVEFLPSPSEGVLRLKMVVSKRQLECVLKEGGDCVSLVEGLLSPLLREAEAAAASSNISCSISWRPSLQSIPEFT